MPWDHSRFWTVPADAVRTTLDDIDPDTVSVTNLLMHTMALPSDKVSGLTAVMSFPSLFRHMDPDEVPPPAWQRVRDFTPHWGFAPVIRDLIFKQLRNDHLVVADYAATLACCLLIECGFVPICRFKPPGITALNAMSMSDRCIRLIRVLDRKLDKDKSLRRVEFLPIIRKHSWSSSESEEEVEEEVEGAVGGETSVRPRSAMRPLDQMEDRTNSSIGNSNTDVFEYGRKLFLNVYYHGDVVISISNAEYHRSVRLPPSIWLPGMGNGNPMSMRYTPLSFFKVGMFDPSYFSHYLKTELFFVLADTYDTYCLEVRGFDCFPDEILFKIAEKLDVFSFNNFMLASKRHHQSLDNNDGWKLMLNRMHLDFPGFDRVDVPPPAAGEDSVTLFKSLYKEKFGPARRAAEEFANRPRRYVFFHPYLEE